MPRLPIAVLTILVHLPIVIATGCDSAPETLPGEVGAVRLTAASEPPSDIAIGFFGAEDSATAASAPIDPSTPTGVWVTTPPQQIQARRIDVEFVGEEIFVSIDGRRVAKEHLRRTDNAIEIIGTAGQVLQTIPIPAPLEHPPVMIGVRFETPGAALTKHIGIDPTMCAIVVAVLQDGPGFVAGIEDFDLITAIDGKSPASPTDIRSKLNSMAPGDSIVLSVRRGSTSKEYSIQSKGWKHVPLPAQLQPSPMTKLPSPLPPQVPGTPNAPADSNANGRPAAAAQRSATP